MANQPSDKKRVGYLVNMAANAILIYIANNLLNWNIPFLLPSFDEVVGAIVLSLSATIFVNFIYVFFDEKWFKSLMQVVLNVFSWITTYLFYTIFPISFRIPIAMQALNIVLLSVLVLIPISTIAEMTHFLWQVYNRSE